MTTKCSHSKVCSLVSILLVTVVAAVARFWFLRWGLPNELHQLSYHPDEALQIGAMLRIKPGSLALDPGFYNYPAGYLNLGAVAVRVAAAWGVTMDGTLTGVYITARALTVVLGVLTIPFVFAAARRFYGDAAGLIAAIVFAIVPLHIVHSHFATVDVPATLWVAAAIFGAIVILERPTLRTYLLAGGAAGLAAGTKYNAGLVLVSVIVAHFVRTDFSGALSRIRDRRLWLSVVGFVAGLLVASPQILIKPLEYSSKFAYETWHAGAGHGLVFEGKGSGWLDVINSLAYGTGPLLLLFFLMAAALAIVRRKPADWVILSFLVPYFLMIAFAKVRFARYAIPMIPPLAILCGRLITEVHSTLKDQGARIMRAGWIAACAGLIVVTSIYSVAIDRLFAPPDARDKSIEWIKTHVPKGATIGVPTVPWFYSPPYTSETTALSRKARYDSVSETSARYVILTSPDPEDEWDPNTIRDNKPDFVVVTDFEYEDPIRLKRENATEYFALLDKWYKRSLSISRNIEVFGVCFGSAEELPHDLKYMAPTIHVYRRK